MKSILNKEQMAAADNRSQVGGEEVVASQAPTEAPVEKEIDQGGVAPKEQVAGTEEVQAKAPEPMLVTLKDGRQLEVDGAEAQRLMQLGIAAGDEETIKAARGLENYISQDPRRAGALKAFIDNPEATEALLKQFGEGGESQGVQETPQDKELRELRAENVRLQNQGKGGGKSQADVIAEAATKYPALKGLAKNTLVLAVKGAMADGKSQASALVELAADQTGSEVAAGDAKRTTMRSADLLTGVGAGGEAPTSTPVKQVRGSNDLKNGTALQNATRRLANG